MNLFEGRYGFKRNKRNHDSLPENITCKNCQMHFDGNYCPRCGQGVKELDRPFGFIFINFVGDLFAFDSRFFRTLKALLFQPGYLSEQFFEGRRIRYATPTRLYILSSFLLFFLLQVYSNHLLTNVLDAPVNSQNVALADSAMIVLTDSLAQNLNSGSDTNRIVMSDISLDLEAFIGKRNLREGLNELSDQLEKQLQQEENPGERDRLREQIRLIRTPEQAIAKILRYMSWAFFLLLPVFALLLNLFYLRKKYYYTRHLVFSIHLHTFIFFIYIILVSLHLLFSKVNAYINLALLGFIPLYFILALRRFYHQRILKTILKFFGITLMYGLLFWLIVGGVFLSAFNLI